MSRQNFLGKNHLRCLFCALLTFGVCEVHAFRWQDLWYTPDQQAETLMKAGEFVKAQSLFQQNDWRAVAAYRARDYKQAAKELENVSTEQGYYNRGNAFAKMEQYEDAIKAYDKALNLNPSNQDALYNRKLVARLLKKKQEQHNQNQENQSKNKDAQDKNDKNQQNNPSQDNNQSKKNDSENKNAEANDEQSSNSQSKDEANQDTPNQDKNNNKNKGEDLKQDDKNQQEQDLEKDKTQTKKDKSTTNTSSQEEREKQQAKEQWLQLIPDDPGGLMREKFLRDYLRRQRGWNQ